METALGFQELTTDDLFNTNGGYYWPGMGMPGMGMGGMGFGGWPMMGMPGMMGMGMGMGGMMGMGYGGWPSMGMYGGYPMMGMYGGSPFMGMYGGMPFSNGLPIAVNGTLISGTSTTSGLASALSTAGVSTANAYVPVINYVPISSLY
jgi:hypothetical protein